MRTAVVVFTRDLRVVDNPTLCAAARSAAVVVPLFVLDEAIIGSRFNAPNRAQFLAESLQDLDSSLRQLGADGLIVRRGEHVEQVAALAEEVDAGAVHISADWSGYARGRIRRLTQRLAAAGRQLVVHPETIAAVAPGTLRPTGGGEHFAVFTPYYNRWHDTTLRELRPAPRLRAARLLRAPLPDADRICPGRRAPNLPPGGEGAGRGRLNNWLGAALERYPDHHDDLVADDTSRLSPYLHFGCLSPVEVIARAAGRPGGEAFVRQLAWREFNLQLLAARPAVAVQDYRNRNDRWRDDPGELAAWTEGRTGIPIVDAGMRQLLREGWMHNRARLITGSFLTKHLYLDWREGAAHFLHHLVDGDLANNQLNWQWVAGTGTDTRPNRVLNPLRQAQRHDPDGAYVRRYVPELSGVKGAAVHQPWKLRAEHRAELDYPDPIIDLAEGRRRFLAAR